MMEEAGEKLKKIRQKLRLSFRDVEEASGAIATRHSSEEFLLALSRLSDIENKGVTPSVYRIYSLCAIYRLDIGRGYVLVRRRPGRIAGRHRCVDA